MTWYVPYRETRDCRAHLFDEGWVMSACGRMRRDQKPWIAAKVKPKNACWLCMRAKGWK